MGALNGKVAIVTGAGQGLGRCHAEFLAHEGAAIIVNDIGDHADEVAEAIVRSGGRAVAAHGSVSDWEQSRELIDLAVEEFGDLHILVNNAGFVRDAMSFSMEQEQWDAVVDVHLKGHFVPSHFAAAYWRQQAKAAGASEGKSPLVHRRIINTTSESGLFGGPAQSNYASAKGGIITMTLVLARELGRYYVTVNAIAPRARTAMTAAIANFAEPESGFDTYDPGHVSPVVAFLASDAAADVSGQVFIVLGDQVHRIRPASIMSSVSAGGKRWSVDDLVAVKDQLIGELPAGVPAWGGPPM